MKTYHNDPKLKEEFVQRMKDHIKADEVIQRVGFKNGRGCAVGCTYDEYNHALGSERLGLPLWYENLRDAIFERLPASEAPQWALDSLQLVPVGVDLRPFRWELAIRRSTKLLDLLKDNHSSYARKCGQALREATRYCEDMLSGNATYEQRKKIKKDARSIESTARLAARAAATIADARLEESVVWTARAAAESAGSAAAWTARAAARATAAAAESAAAESAYWQWERDTLIKLLNEKRLKGLVG